MIWFACKKCGKTHGRPETQAGTLVFCDCSFGNRVPWSSTVAEPPTPPAPEPIPVPIPIPPHRPEAQPSRIPEAIPTRPIPTRRVEDEPRSELPRRRREPRRANPRYCLNHENAASEAICVDCKMSFCAGCVVTLQGQSVCGPCKNFRVRGLNRPARVTALSVITLVIGLVSGPVTFCLGLFNMGGQQMNPSIAVVIMLTLVGLVLPAAALVLARYALREMETKPNTGGRSLALTGAITGLVGVLWALTIGAILVYKQTGG
jgi:hypothetical protein